MPDATKRQASKPVTYICFILLHFAKPNTAATSVINLFSPLRDTFEIYEVLRAASIFRIL